MKKFFVVCLFFLATSACGGQQNNQPANSTHVVHQPGSQTSVPPITHHHKVGETVDASGWTITLNSVHTQASFGTDMVKMVPSQAGYVYLVIALTAKNILTKEQSLDDPQFVLRDTSGNTYSSSYVTGHNIVSSQVEAGSPLKGDLSYEVPPTVHQFVLRFAPAVTDVTPPTVIWDLQV
jgi:hypothetical protein